MGRASHTAVGAGRGTSRPTRRRGVLLGLMLTCLASGAGCGGATQESGEVTGETGTQDRVAARGIRITKVTANAGTQVDLTQGGTYIETDERSVRLPRDRDTLIQVHYEIDDGFMHRQVEARLHLHYPDGRVETRTQVTQVSADSNELLLGSTFYFDLAAARGETSAGIRFQVDLWEVGDGGASLPARNTRSPEAGPEPIGFEDATMEMNIVFVPIEFEGNVPSLSAEDKTYILEKGLSQYNPLQRVNVEWHEPVEYETPLENLGFLLPRMAQLREAEGRGVSNWYYAAIIQAAPGVGGTTGIANIVSAGLAEDRVSATVWLVRGTSTRALVHEVAHTQGLLHAPCGSGGAGELALDFPDPEGRTGTTGFGIRDFELRAADAFDYMSYCGPSWVSPWSWAQTYERIRVLSAESDRATPDVQMMLKGVVASDGQAVFWKGAGSYDSTRSSWDHKVSVEFGSQQLTTHAEVSMLSDGETLWIEAPLPGEGGRPPTRMTYRGPQGEFVLDPERLVSGKQQRSQVAHNE